MSQPLFVLGAPRSGTTFLCHTLNQHPSIQLTNESRIFVLLKDFIEMRSTHPELLEPIYRSRFQAFARRHAGRWVEEFYREALGNTAPIWGDKHPCYGDPAVLSKRENGIMAYPRSGSCLRLIRDCLPTARFIHLHRHPWQVATSMKQRGWVASRSEGLQVWRQHVTEIEDFFAELPPQQWLSLSYAELIEHPNEIAAEIGRFLNLGTAHAIGAFLASQRAAPTHFSSPTSNPRQPLRMEAPGERGRMAWDRIAEAAALLGYQPDDASPNQTLRSIVR